MELIKKFNLKVCLYFLTGAVCFVSQMAWSAGSSTGGGSIYCCDLSNGQPLCGDNLPPACYGRNYREISPQGITLRHVEGEISPEERAKREAVARAKKEDERKKQMQQQEDNALLASYINLADLDARRDRQAASLQKEIDELNARRDITLKKQAEIEGNIDRLATEKKKEGIPADLLAQKQAAEDELRSIRSLLESKNNDINTIRSRFEAQRKRYLELTSGKK